jgi:hypothetical protein
MQSSSRKIWRAKRIALGLVAITLAVVGACRPPTSASSSIWSDEAKLNQVEAEFRALGPQVVPDENAIWQPIRDSQIVGDMAKTANVRDLEKIVRRNDLIFTRGAAFYALEIREPEKSIERAIDWLYSTLQPLSAFSLPAQKALISATVTKDTVRQMSHALGVGGVKEANIAIVASLIPNDVLDAWFHSNEPDPANRFVQFAAHEVFANYGEHNHQRTKRMNEFLMRCRDQGGPAATTYFLYFDAANTFHRGRRGWRE